MLSNRVATRIQGVGAWYAGVLDMDVENGRFYWNGATYPSETALLAAMANASKSTGARSIGPYVFGTEVMSDPEFASGVSGIADPPTTGPNGTVSQTGGRLNIAFDGVGSNYRPRVALTVPSARRAYYAEAQMASNTGLDAVAVNLSNDTNLGSSAGALFSLGALPDTKGVVLGNPSTTLYAGFNCTDAALNGSGQIEYLRVKECSPFNGLVQESISGYIDITTPASFSGTKTAFELGDDTLTVERIAVDVNASGVATFSVVNNGASQAAIALGTLTTATRYRIDFSLGPNRIVAKISGSAAVADVSASVPGVGKLWIGRGSGGSSTWDGPSDLVKRFVIRAGEYLPDGAVYAEGDSYIAGAAGVSLPVTGLADSRAIVTTAVGGSTLNNALLRVQAQTGKLAANGVFIFWDGDGSNGFTTIEQAAADYAALIGALGHSRFLILSPLKRANLSSQANTDTGSIQTMLAANYPNNYINAQAILAAHATSPGDDSMVAAGQVPDSLLQADDTHLTSSAMGFVWSDATVGVKAVLTAKGW